MFRLAHALCLSGLVLALMQQACAGELGPCDGAAASQLVYSETGFVATKGQALLHDSCGAGAFCHSSQAKGKDRLGAPAGLDFDMLPAAGWPKVIEHRELMWASVLDGTMPPEGEAGVFPVKRFVRRDAMGSCS